MKIKTTLAALALITAPALASAMCSDKTHQAMSCAEGTVWDSASQACVSQVNS
ncbi:carbohydrate-binding module family 14 protein [Lutimaribacter sp. EGI FJ00015]|uniref:Carbohydrate-binding module family 14 protein n=1 Tax=Lutimaribacter degradans TaxID=2945989 RepID=A0ACC5ZT87_9RHOB|nr:carbohydrate-binding module family 14 protein [Lutimaribacter sp. EGI FJ00013]MCM2560991.1 carbohydrate-binding module family 14 protein [Lutimaribacter sp. EGI FJ00013]MCO0612062.1 carbohydrate-binding module family 14 protein [Lutimaribacter sp. EGI FJ00015]MCO0634818.1 carbohydrate-binding module family 14 protein [Lutimaribacter sp. EGI FJ00014]